MVWKKMLVEKFQDGCIVHGHFWCVNGVIIVISESPYCWKPSINLIFKRIYGLEEDVGWKIPRWLFSAWPPLMCEWDVFCYFWEIHYVRKLPQVFAQRNIWFGRRWYLKNSNMAVKYMVIFDEWMGWFSYYAGSLSSSCVQENIWFERRCWLKNSKMAV